MMINTPQNSVERMASASVWLFLDRTIRLVMGFVVSIFVARHYGPSEWGALSYVMASAILFGSIASAGSENLILRDLAKKDSEQGRADIQKTALALRLGFGTIAYLSLLILVATTQGFSLPFYLALVYGLIFIFQASEIWEYRLRIEHHLPLVAKTHICSSLLSNTLKIVTLLMGWPLIAIAVAMSTEYAGSLIILARYRARHWSTWVGKFQAEYARTLIKASSLVMLSSFLIALQSRSEFYLINHFLGLEAVGLYAAAFKSIELVDVLILIFTMILVPELSKRHHLELPILASRTYLLGFLFYMVMLLPIALLYFIFPWIYGAKFNAAQMLIPWLALRPLFIILGTIRGIFLVMEDRLRYVPICAAVGLASTVIAGSFLIPVLGLEGAAVSGLIGLAISNFVMDIFFQPKNISRMVSSFRQWPYAVDRCLEILKLRKPQI
jgi:O-antigen/teichoic acid export membrane protein